MRTFVLVCLLFVAISSSLLAAQESSCTIPEALLTHKEHTIFDESQENDLGDAFFEGLSPEMQIVEGPLNDYLVALGERLVSQLPPTKLRFTFRLVELSTANAFTYPGNRIYVGRKLVTTANSEDEVVAVLAHEIGHAYMRHASATASRMLETVLSVRTVGDRKDIYEKVHLLTENLARKKLPNGPKEESEQDDADRLGAYLVARAGYRPEAAAEFWDRTFEVKGKTGSGLSDFFGTTKPNEKRLRLIRKLTAELPPECHPARHPDTPAFSAWQSAVLVNEHTQRKSSVSALARTVHLFDPILPEISNLKFSPDGHNVFAQDEFGINVLQYGPLKFLFRIPAEDANPAHFSGDSRSVVFHDDNLRVEKWNIAEQKRSQVQELQVAQGCVNSEVSPDGAYFACFTPDLHMRLIDVTNNSVLFEDKNPGRPMTFWDWFVAEVGSLRLMTAIRFSEDSRYVAFRSFREPAAYEISTKQKVKLPGSLQNIMRSSFNFIASNAVIGVNNSEPQDSAVMEFPSGRRLNKISVGRQEIVPATRGGYAFLHPIVDYPTGVFGLNDNKLLFGIRTYAVDAFGDKTVNENRAGEVATYKLEASKPTLIESIKIPAAEISRVRSLSVSQDLRYIAFSSRTRGGIWDLTTGKRLMLIRSFDRSTFIDDHLIASFPLEKNDPLKAKSASETSKEQSEPTQIVADIAISRNSSTDIEQDSERTILAGPYLLSWRYDQPKKGATTLEVKHVREKSVAWGRSVRKGVPQVIANQNEDTLTFLWPLVSEPAKEDLRADPALGARAKLMKEKAGDYLVEVVKLSSGDPIGKILIETGKGSFHVHDISASRQRLAISDNHHRVLLYSYKSDSVDGRHFGDRPALCGKEDLLAFRTEKSSLRITDLHGEKSFDASFASPIVALRFANDCSKLLVLTGDEAVTTVDMKQDVASVN